MSSASQSNMDKQLDHLGYTLEDKIKRLNELIQKLAGIYAIVLPEGATLTQKLEIVVAHAQNISRRG